MHTIDRHFPDISRKEAEALWNRFSNFFSAEHNKHTVEALMASIVLRVAAEVIVRDLARCSCITGETNVLAQQVLECKSNREVFELYETDKDAFDSLIFTDYLDEECKEAEVADAIFAEVHCRALSLLLECPEVNTIPAQLHEDIVELISVVKA